MRIILSIEEEDIERIAVGAAVRKFPIMKSILSVVPPPKENSQSGKDLGRALPIECFSLSVAMWTLRLAVDDIKRNQRRCARTVKFTRRAWEGYDCPMDCPECEDLNRRHAVATDRYLEADRQRKAYVAEQPISGRDVVELARLDQEVENTKRKRDDLVKEYARHRREVHPKGRAS